MHSSSPCWRCELIVNEQNHYPNGNFQPNSFNSINFINLEVKGNFQTHLRVARFISTSSIFRKRIFCNYFMTCHGRQHLWQEIWRRLIFTLQQSCDLYNIIEANFKQNQQSPDWDEMIFCYRSNWLLSDKHQDRIVIIHINFIVNNPLNIKENANAIIPVRT